jgi:hypothetical protein
MEAATTQGGPSRSWAPPRIGETEVRLLLVVAMVAAAGFGLWSSRGTTFSIDEFRVFLASSHVDLRELLSPLNGHLILITRLVYAGIFNVFGAGYLPFRLLATGTLLLTAWLFFVFAERRVGSLLALAPTLVLLVYGSDYYHVILGNGFTVLSAVAAGLGALLLLERGDRFGDIGACLLLTLGVASYSVALPYVAGVAVFILIGSDRWRRAWVFVVPAVLYAIWFLWARNQPGGAGDVAHLHNLLLAPNWAFNSLATVASAVLGLNYTFAGFGNESLLQFDTSWGPPVAAIAIVAFAWRLWRGPIQRWLWALMAVPAFLWLIAAAVAAPPIRTPQKSEYIFPATVAVLLVAVEALRHARLGRRAILAAFILAAVGVITNIALLREGSARLRSESSQTRAELAAVDMSGKVGLDRQGSPALGVLLIQPDGPNEYSRAVAEFGSPAFSATELRSEPEIVRQRFDTVLAENLQLHLEPASGPQRGCRRVTATTGAGVTLPLPPGGATLRAIGAAAPLKLRRFASAYAVDAGTLEPGTPMKLAIPPDKAPGGWYAATPATRLTVCSL